MLEKLLKIPKKKLSGNSKLIIECAILLFSILNSVAIILLS